MRRVRKPIVAGLFYPNKEKELSHEVEYYLSNYKPQLKFENVFGLVAPHAGYKYSGGTAAYAYNCLKKRDYKNIFILSPSHREYFQGICIYDGDAFLSPLGIVNINKDLCEQLTVGEKFIFKGLDGHRQEHAIEVHIPFLQSIFNDFKIIPIVMGNQSKFLVDLLADKLSKIVDETCLIIASSDLSHYYSDAISNQLDSIVEQNINDFDYEKLQHNLDNKICEACGGGLIVSLMKSAKLYGNENAKVLFRCNSGDSSNDYSEVVGYLSAAIYK